MIRKEIQLSRYRHSVFASCNSVFVQHDCVALYGTIKCMIITDNFIRDQLGPAATVIRERDAVRRLYVYYVTFMYSGLGAMRAAECTDDRRQPAGRRCIVDVTPKSSDVRPCCNVLTVSQRRAISRLIARRKRPAVSNVACLAESSIGLCAVYARQTSLPAV